MATTRAKTTGAVLIAAAFLIAVLLVAAMAIIWTRSGMGASSVERARADNEAAYREKAPDPGRADSLTTAALAADLGDPLSVRWVIACFERDGGGILRPVRQECTLRSELVYFIDQDPAAAGPVLDEAVTALIGTDLWTADSPHGSEERTDTLAEAAQGHGYVSTRPSDSETRILDPDSVHMLRPNSISRQDMDSGDLPPGGVEVLIVQYRELAESSLTCRLTITFECDAPVDKTVVPELPGFD